MAELEGAGVVVTGAAAGIGRATVLRLVRDGATVLAVDVDEAGLGTLEGQAAPGPGRVLGHRADVTVGDEVAGYVGRAREELPSLRGFFNNAGIEGVHKDLADTSEEEWDRTMAINLRAVFLGLKHVLAAMADEGGGSIVNTGSILSLKAAPGRADYVVSKHAVLGLTRSAACEGASRGVQVNSSARAPWRRSSWPAPSGSSTRATRASSAAGSRPARRCTATAVRRRSPRR